MVEQDGKHRGAVESTLTAQSIDPATAAAVSTTAKTAFQVPSPLYSS